MLSRNKHKTFGSADAGHMGCLGVGIDACEQALTENNKGFTYR